MVIESMFILKCEFTVERMVALNVFNEVMNLLTSFADSHVTYLSVRLLLLALLRLFTMPGLPESMNQSLLPLFNLVLTRANTAYGYYEEKRNSNEEDEVDYEELLERIEGGLNSREDQPINRVAYHSRLIVRGSTGKPRSGGL